MGTVENDFKSCEIISIFPLMAKRKPEFEWEVIRLTASPARFIGTVNAPDEETAREIAIEQYQIRPQQQRSLLVRKA